MRPLRRGLRSAALLVLCAACNDDGNTHPFGTPSPPGLGTTAANGTSGLDSSESSGSGQGSETAPPTQSDEAGTEDVGNTSLEGGADTTDVSATSQGDTSQGGTTQSSAGTTEASDSEDSATTGVATGDSGAASTSTADPTTDGSRCGNGIAEGDEQCDGDDLQGQTCSDFDHIGGTLGCDDDCTVDTSDCGPSCGGDGDSCVVDTDCCAGSACDALFGCQPE